MISPIQALILGLLQGFSELFPISSLGHSVILPKLVGWSINQNDPAFITFLVATHLATALVLVGFFWKEWVDILRKLGRSLREREVQETNKLGWLLIVGTIPVGVIYLLFEPQVRQAFASAQSAALFLALNGLLLYGAELLRRKATLKTDQDLNRLSFGQAVGIGTIQSLALIPGFSRSGASMAGGLLAGLSNEEAAKFSFLLATPAIGAAALLKLPDLIHTPALWGPAAIGAAAAGLTAAFSIRFLMRYFESERLTPFAIYCLVAGIVTSLLLWGR